MAFLTIAGADYDVLTSGATETYDRHGESFRAFSGRHRTVRVGPDKRNWNFELGPLTQAMLDTLKVAIGLGPVSVTGNALNSESVTCDVEIDRLTYVDGGFGGNDFYYRASVRIIEQ